MSGKLLQANIPPARAWVVSPQGHIKPIAYASNLAGGILRPMTMANGAVVPVVSDRARADGWVLLRDIATPEQMDLWEAHQEERVLAHRAKRPVPELDLSLLPDLVRERREA